MTKYYKVYPAGYLTPNYVKCVRVVEGGGRGYDTWYLWNERDLWLRLWNFDLDCYEAVFNVSEEELFAEIL